MIEMFYWMLLNVHPAYRSTLHSIQLLAVAKSTDIRTYGIDAVLTPLIADMKTPAGEVNEASVTHVMIKCVTCIIIGYISDVR